MAQSSSEFNDPETLRTCLQMLSDECSKDELRIAIETILKLCKNISTSPGDEKYRRIRKENKAIHDKVLRFDGALEFLLAMGWTQLDDFLMFLDDQDVLIAIGILEEHLHTLPPASTASATPTATPTPVSPGAPGTVWTDEELKKKEKQIEDEKKKRMEEYKRMKREKEEIKKQISEDRKDSNNREVKASHARQLAFGANVRKFENKGG